MQSRVLVIGAGGHAGVCVEALLDDPNCAVVGCVSKTGEPAGQRLTDAPGSGITVVGSDDDIDVLIGELAVTDVFVAVTNNRRRAEMIARCASTGVSITRAVSRGAYVSRSAVIGAGVLLAPGAVVNASARLGDGVIINTNASVGHDSVIGAASHIGPGVAMGGTVLIGAQVLVGIGARVLPGISIGDHATIGAGSVVVRDVPAGAMMVGNPARQAQARRR